MTITGIPRPGRAIIVQPDGELTLPWPAPLKPTLFPPETWGFSTSGDLLMQK